jgi:tetratricopeptide (TPR) repeat protein
MKVPYTLRPVATPEPATALLLPGRRAEDVLCLCATLGLDPLPPIYRVADGFLIKLSRPLDVPVAGTIRLRSLSPDLLLPVDAELVPPLLLDEAMALVRQRGLVFLPGGRVLEYRPDTPMALAELVHVGVVRRRSWQALPEPPELADDVSEIALHGEGLPPEVLLEAGGAGVGGEEPTIPDAGLPSQIVGKTLFGVGKGFAWLGKTLRLPRLAGIGADMVSRALSLVPRLSEELLGKQEAMLRNLLREFREGDIDKALRRALPLGNEAARGNVAAQNAQLPSHDLYYSLVNLLGTRGGPSSIWFGGGSTYYELLQEYRKQAEQAASRGDFRRAAFIYGKLLRDYRSAALVLARGGLHRDAAILYEKALHDPPAAAREWEAAGEIDRALRIYLKLGDHALAGDLLRRAGEEERAVAEYQRAAAKLVESGPRHFEAGELLATRAQRPDLALPYFRDGWAARPHGSPMPCGLRLAKHHAAAGESERLLELIGEADTLLEPWDVELASQFYNELARLADRPTLHDVAAEVRDRARMGLARKLAQAGGVLRGGDLIAGLFPAASPWPAPLVRDADHALRQTSRRAPAPAPASQTLQRVRPSIVRAAHQLPASKDVFLGLENGEVICYRPSCGEVATIAKEHGPILSISSHSSDEHISILSQAGSQRVCLSIVARSNGYRMLNYQHIATEGPAWLCSGFDDRSTRLVGVCVGHKFQLFRAPELIAAGSLGSADPEAVPITAVIGPTESSRGGGLLAFYPGWAECYPSATSEGAFKFAMPWTPDCAEEGGLAHAALHAVWGNADPLEITGLTAIGSIRTSRLRPGAVPLVEATIAWTGGDERFWAFTRIRGDLLAAVGCKGVHWLRGGSARRAAPVTPVSVARPVAAFTLPVAGEVLVVGADCTLTRVPIRE